MKLDYLKEHLKQKKKLVSTVLLGISVLSGIMILVKVTSFFVAAAKAESVVKRAIEKSESDPNAVKKQLAKSETIADDLKKNNLFAPPPPKQHPVKEVLGIFGDEALINGKWYKVGDKVGDAKIVAIGPTAATIEWDGKEKAFLPIQAVIPEAPKQPKSGKAIAKEGQTGEQGAEMVTVQPEAEQEVFGGRMESGEGFMGMRRRFENMSDEERQAMRDRMRERFGFGGRGGPGGERGPRGRRRQSD